MNPIKLAQNQIDETVKARRRRCNCSEFDVLATKFAEACSESREKMAKKLIEAGYNPNYVTTGERIWFDEETNCMKHECFAINKDVDV